MDANAMLNSRFINATDLRGRAVRVTIARVEEARFRDGTCKLVLSFENARKQLPLNKTNLRAVIAVLGTAETDQWPGQRLTLEPRKVDFGGQLVDAVRVAAPPEPPPPPPARKPVAPAAPPTREPGDEEFHATDEDVPF